MARSPLVLAVVAACGGGSGDERGVERAPPLAAAAFYRLDAAPQPPCNASAPCEARVVLTALGDYHVNAQYPQKFVADVVPGVAVDGTGAFSLARATAGTLAIRFRAERPGSYTLRGTFKLGVCNADDCQIETPAIAIPVMVR